MKARSRQRELTFVGWGGKRKGAGRKRASGAKPRVAHRHRSHKPSLPSLVTLRVLAGVADLRIREVYLAVEDAIRSGRDRFGFRVTHHSAIGNHLHLIVEADTEAALTKGMRGLVIRMAKAINRALNRRGRVFDDRFHARDLSTPTEVRNALLYTLNNAKHHAAESGHAWASRKVDPCSSAKWFDGWSTEVQVARLEGPSPVAPAKTWLLRVGWRRLGLIHPDEVPVGGRRPRGRPGVPWLRVRAARSASNG